MVLTYNTNEEGGKKGKKSLKFKIESIKQLSNEEWMVKTEQGLSGDSMYYLDKIESKKEDDEKRARERLVMQEGM